MINYPDNCPKCGSVEISSATNPLVDEKELFRCEDCNHLWSNPEDLMDKKEDLTIEEALSWCHKNNVEAEFFSSHVELKYGSGYFNSSEVEFLDAVKNLKRMVEC